MKNLTIKLLYGFLLIGLWEVNAVMGRESSSVDLSAYVPVQYCHLVQNSKEFNGKKLVVRVSYRYGEEWQEMFALKCRDKNTRVEFEPETEDAERAINRVVRRVPRHQGTINATFMEFFTKNTTNMLPAVMFMNLRSGLSKT